MGITLRWSPTAADGGTSQGRSTMLALVVLLQISIATPPSLDAARRALHTADTAAAA